MSYQVTAYFGDVGIYSTHIYWSQVGIEYLRYYGNDYLQVGGFYGAMQFTANPQLGYSFSRWAYRVGSVSGTVQYSYSNPFTYFGEQDIYIRAESTSSGGTASWALSMLYFGAINNAVSVPQFLQTSTLYRIEMSFTSSGIATFYTSGSVDTRGYLGTSFNYDTSSGVPYSYVAENDDGGGSHGTNFSISYNVAANTTYYLWVRGYSGSTSGNIAINIDPPSGAWKLVTDNIGIINSSVRRYFDIAEYTLYRISVSFSKAGSATFYSGGTLDLRGYVGITTGYDNVNGYPSQYLAQNNDIGGGDMNFRITLDVSAGTIYYIWFRCYEATTTGSCNIYIIPPTDVAASDGSVYIYTATGWRKATPYIYTYSGWQKMTSCVNAGSTWKKLI